MSISMEQIKELKSRTGAGIVDCKKILTETNGDMDESIKILREKGLVKAAKKEGRETKEGTVAILESNDRKTGLLVKVNCETDFVARTDDFQNFAKETAKIILDKSYTPSDALPTELEELRTKAVAKLGENITIPTWTFIKAKGELSSYAHLGKVGVIADFANIADDEAGKTAKKSICMQIAAMNPLGLSREDIPAEEISKEKEIYMEEAKQSGKPENIALKIIEGKLNKFYEENTLLDQEFILDGDKKVKDVLKDYKADASVLGFIRLGL